MGAAVAAPPPAAGLPADWPTYHRDNRRTGLDPGFRPVSRLMPGWSRRLDGAVYASPVVAAGTLIAVTENNGVYGFDPANGRQRWYRRLAPPVRLSRLAQLGAPCGNIDPLGVTGTPAYDPRTRRVFVVTESEERPGRIVHRLVGLDPAGGAVRLSRPVPPPRGNPAAHQQRGALAVANGRVYVPYGGLYGDCGNYVGSVVASRTDGTGRLDSFAVPTPREGGIWAPPGPTVNDRGTVYVQVGNGESTRVYDYSDSVLALGPDLAFDRRDPARSFSPTSWAQHNRDDDDLGSSGPVLTPNGFVLAVGKPGTAYVLRQRRLGGIGGQVSATQLGDCSSYGGASINATTVYVPCDDGVVGLMVRDDGTLRQNWKAPPNINGSPVQGTRTLFVTSQQDGRLYALDKASGVVLASVGIGRVTRFATPALSGGMVYVGTYNGVVAVRSG